MAEDREGIIIPTTKSAEGLKKQAQETRVVPVKEGFDRTAYQEGLKTRVFLKLDERLISPEGVKIREEIEATRRRDPEASLFNLVHDKLKDFVDNPNLELEGGLKEAQQILIDAAKEAGALMDAKNGLLEAQMTDDWSLAEEAVEGINVGALEHQATEALEKRSPDFAGMNSEYVRIGRLNMDHAKLVAQGKGNTEEARKLKREIDLLGWGNPPLNLVDQAKDYLERKVRLKAGRPEEETGRLLEQRIAAAETLTVEVADAIKEAMGDRLELRELEFKDLRKGSLERAEAQRSRVRHFLDTIEKSNRDCFDRAIATIVLRLEASEDLLEPAVAKEVKARLAVHDASMLITQARGFIQLGDARPIASAAAEAKHRGHDLTRETVEFFLKKEEHPGLKIAEAWNLLQRVNSDEYPQILEKVLGAQKQEKKPAWGVKPLPPNYFTENDPEAKGSVKKWIIEQLIVGQEGQPGIEDAAKKSLQLAERFAVATLENSVFNHAAVVGNDELAEIIYLIHWRKKRAEQGRERGPGIHEWEITGFGTSWLRLLHHSDLEARFKVNKARESLVKAYEEHHLRADEFMRRWKALRFPYAREEISLTKGLSAEDALKGLDQITGTNEWEPFCGLKVSRYNELRSLLMKKNWKPDEIDLDLLQRAIPYFIDANKTRTREMQESEPLEPWWIAGVVAEALSNPSLEWDTPRFSFLRTAVSRQPLSLDPKFIKRQTFFGTEHWQWIERATGFREKLSQLERYYAKMRYLRKKFG